MKVKVIKFIVTPIYAIIDNEELVITAEGEGPAFLFYPGNPFNINEVVKQTEQHITKRLGIAEQLSLFDATNTSELRTQ